MAPTACAQARTCRWCFVASLGRGPNQAGGATNSCWPPFMSILYLQNVSAHRCLHIVHVAFHTCACVADDELQRVHGALPSIHLVARYSLLRRKPHARYNCPAPPFFHSPCAVVCVHSVLERRSTSRLLGRQEPHAHDDSGPRATHSAQYPTCDRLLSTLGVLLCAKYVS